MSGKPKGTGTRIVNGLESSAVIFIILAALLAFVAANIAIGNISSLQPQSQSASTSNLVGLDVVADYAGVGYDAYVTSNYLHGYVPTYAGNGTPPGPLDNNLTVNVGVPVVFIITNPDTGLNLNYTGTATNTFSIYNDTDSGVVVQTYKVGSLIPTIDISHTFTVPSLGINVPVPPDTIVTFTYTFMKPGIYFFTCTTPCGFGMGITGYMQGYVIVK